MSGSPELGFETAGNATLVVHDRGPVLVTDPWIRGSAYFGSWGLAHEIPADVEAAVRATPAVWFSHGHPDHLNPASLPWFRDARILLPDHVGGRIARELARDGYRVEVLPDRRWVPISERVRVLCIADPLQDAVLLVDVGGRLVVNLNDAADHGWSGLVKRTIRAYPTSYLLRLAGYGDADMINVVDEDGRRVASTGQLRKESGFAVGADVARMTELFGATHFVPFSSFHRYQRTDSEWANAVTTPISDYEVGFRSDRVTLLPAFVRCDCETGEWERLDAPAVAPVSYEPSAFGDDWAESLNAEDRSVLDDYFGAVEHLRHALDAITFRVGGAEHRVVLGGRATGRSLTFAAPRASLLQAVRYAIFDDLLIGNFARTTLHGRWPRSGLYPDFTPYVTKYADNGGAHTEAEVREYLAEYRRRAGPGAWMRAAFTDRARDALRARLPADSATFRIARDAARRLRV